jgi:hypothetical protein
MPLYSDFKSAKIVKFKNVAISKNENDFEFFRSSHFRFFITFSPAIRSIFLVLLAEVLEASTTKKDAASPEASGSARIGVFVFKTYKTFCIFEILTQNPNQNEKNPFCFLNSHFSKLSSYRNNSFTH